MRAIAVMIVSLICVSCSKSVWVKPGSNQEDFGKDNLACLQQSQQIESRSGTSASINSAYGAYESKSRTGSVTNMPMYNSCMNARGWTMRNSSDVAESAARNKAFATEKNDRLKSIQSQIAALCETDEYKPFTVKTTCLQGDVMALPMLTDNTKINKAQKIAMEGYIKDRDRLINEQESILLKGADKNLTAKISCANDKVKPIQKKNELALYKGQITWGQYNTQKAELKGIMKRVCN